MLQAFDSEVYVLVNHTRMTIQKWSWDILSDVPTTPHQLTLTAQQMSIIASALSSMQNPTSWDTDETTYYNDVAPAIMDIYKEFDGLQ